MRMMAGQIVVIAVGALTLAATAALIAPRLFTYHFDQTGEADGIVRYHAQQAFESSFALALVLGVMAAQAPDQPADRTTFPSGPGGRGRQLRRGRPA